MSTYHLHARLVVGPLGSFTQDLTRVSGADSWATIQAEARELARRGFTVWLYEHGSHAFATASNLRLVARLDPDPPTAHPRRA